MTSPQSILSVLWAQGFTVELGQGGSLLVSPASTLHDSQREILRANKQEIVRYLEQCQAQAKRLQDELIRAAMRACDCWGDSPERREEMRQDCINTPDELKPELLKYFQVVYRDAEKRPVRAREGGDSVTASPNPTKSTIAR